MTTSAHEPGVSVRSYRPGGWFGIVGERAVVILPPTEKPRVSGLWELVDGGAGFDVTLDALISGGLRDLPGFVLVSTAEGETRVVIRGPARAEFTVDGETVEIEGSSATTWVERSLSGVSRMTVVLEDGEDDLPDYVVDGGLFRISRLEESPAHEGPDELGEEPAYEREFPLVEEPSSEPEIAEPMLRSPEPPSWTPGPPPLPPLPPVPQPATELMPDPLPDPTPEPDLVPDLVPDVVPELAEPEAAAQEEGELDADHDGETQMPAFPPVAPSAPPGIPGQPPAPDVTRPVAKLLLSTGDVVDVDRAVIIGRAPEARRFSPTEQPRLVTVPSPHLEISSTHVEVRPGTGADHGSAVVTDLGSTNGTVVEQPGLGREELSPGVAVQLLPGAVIDLGDGLTIRVANP